MTVRGVLVARIEPVPDDPWLAVEQAGTLIPPARPGNLADIPTPPGSPGPPASEILATLPDTERWPVPSPRVAYVDTSALAKLLRTEAESANLKAFLRAYPRVVSGALARPELLRVAHRLGAGHVATAEQILDTLAIVPVSAAIPDRAGRLAPGSALRSLDAIHLASALSLPTLDVLITYDTRQADAAAILGLPVAAPT